MMSANEIKKIVIAGILLICITYCARKRRK